MAYIKSKIYYRVFCGFSLWTYILHSSLRSIRSFGATFSLRHYGKKITCPMNIIKGSRISLYDAYHTMIVQYIYPPTHTRTHAHTHAHAHADTHSVLTVCSLRVIFSFLYMCVYDLGCSSFPFCLSSLYKSS